jgi:hypothetical protein
MKKLLFMATLAVFSIASAQDSKAYLGVSIGAAIPTGALADNAESGLDIGIINAGYRFNETFGVTLNWGASGHSGTDDYEGLDIGVGYLAVGPMISFGNFDFKPRYAISKANLEGYSEELSIDVDIDLDVKTAFIIGGTYNMPLDGNWALAANFDYFTFKSDNQTVQLEDSAGSLYDVKFDSATYNMLKMTIGIQYQF